MAHDFKLSNIERRIHCSCRYFKLTNEQISSLSNIVIYFEKTFFCKIVEQTRYLD